MAHFSMPKHIVTGKNALAEASVHLSSYGEKALVVTGKHVGKSPMMAQLIHQLNALGIAFAIFDGITGEPTVEMIEAGKKIFLEQACQFCIGIGGGSPLDAAKAIAVMSTCNSTISELRQNEISGPIPPIIAIPTTAGTGSETTKFTVITDQKADIKTLLKGEAMIPSLAIVNPDFSLDMPKSVTAATGLDAFTHAVEAYTSKKAFALTDTLAISAVTRIIKYLPRAYQNGFDGKSREEMSLAALEAGICINNSSVTLVHGMSRPIGALFHVPHGISNAMLLSTCLRFALDGAPERFAQLAYATKAAVKGEDTDTAAEKFLQQVEQLCRICEIPTLKEYGIRKEEYEKNIPKMAADAVASGSPDNTRKKVSIRDCEKIYKLAYA